MSKYKIAMRVTSINNLLYTMGVRARIRVKDGLSEKGNFVIIAESNGEEFLLYESSSIANISAHLKGMSHSATICLGRIGSFPRSRKDGK